MEFTSLEKFNAVMGMLDGANFEDPEDRERLNSLIRAAIVEALDRQEREEDAKQHQLMSDYGAVQRQEGRELGRRDAMTVMRRIVGNLGGSPTVPAQASETMLREEAARWTGKAYAAHLVQGGIDELERMS